MTMDKDAIERIQELGSMDSIIEQINKRDLNSELMVIPEGMKLVPLDKYTKKNHEYRFSFSTIYIDQFIDYNRENYLEGCSACFISTEEMVAKTIFDLGTQENPMHKIHTATISLEKTPFYSALLLLCERPVSQERCVEFLDEWSDYYNLADDFDVLINNKEAISMLKNITINSKNEVSNSVGFANVGTSTMNSVEVNEKISYPRFMNMYVEPFYGLHSVNIYVRIKYIFDDKNEKVSICFSIHRIDQLGRKILENFQHILRDEMSSMSDTFKIYVGDSIA